VDQVLAYGPDDPAYGPPGPGWYKRDSERASWTENVAPPAAPAAGARVARGPFEPLRPDDPREAGYADYEPADYQPAEGEPAFDGPDVGPLENEISEYQPIDYEVSELLDFGTPTDPEAGALGQVRDLYQTAETISPASLDSNFDQLLERQRELISEYFKESVQAEPSAPLGFDTAESLAALRGDLRVPSE
jgi:hypothetical protein